METSRGVHGEPPGLLGNLILEVGLRAKEARDDELRIMARTHTSKGQLRCPQTPQHSVRSTCVGFKSSPQLPWFKPLGLQPTQSGCFRV